MISRNDSESRIPGRAGLGLRRELIPAMQETPPALDFVELAPENWMDMGGRFRAQLEWAASRYPLVCHGLSLSLGGPAPLDIDFLRRLRRFLALALGPPAPSSECLQIGPFLTQIDLRRAMNAIAPAAQRIQFRETREVIRRGYRVFLPSPGSREAALEQARLLSRKGVSDYYVVTAGDEQNTISLGMYREQDNADTRLAQVRALGFEARVEPRNEELPQFWIDAELPQGSDWRARLGGYAGVGGQPIPCAPLPTPAVGGGDTQG